MNWVGRGKESFLPLPFTIEAEFIANSKNNDRGRSFSQNLKIDEKFFF